MSTQAIMAGATRAQQKAAHHHNSGPRSLLRQRALMEKLLGHHVILAIRMMRAQVRSAPDLVHILRDELSINTGALVAAVRAVHGATASRTFRELWTAHNVALVQYAEAIANNDQDGENNAAADLDLYRERFAKFAESVTGSKLDARSVASSLGTHIDQLLHQIRAYATGKYTIAYRLERKAFGHMFPAGSLLTDKGSSHHPGELPIRLRGPAQKLRSALARLLGEHVELLVDTTRAGLQGSPEFKEAAAALNGNTRDLADAFSALVGNKNARTFNSVWSRHIDSFVDYTVGTAQGRDKVRQQARNRLSRFPNKLGGYLARVTGNKRGIAAAGHELGMHDDLLLDQIDAYADGDYAEAHQASYQAYQDMFSVASKLSAVIAKKVGKGAPKGGIQTGGGGTASHRVH
jgi:hypothetical protein